MKRSKTQKFIDSILEKVDLSDHVTIMKSWWLARQELQDRIKSQMGWSHPEFSVTLDQGTEDRSINIAYGLLRGRTRSEIENSRKIGENQYGPYYINPARDYEVKRILEIYGVSIFFQPEVPVKEMVSHRDESLHLVS